MPKIVDAFTGHEAAGEYADECKMLFRQAAFERFGDLIDDLNLIVSGARFSSDLDAACHQLLCDEGLNDESGEKLFEAIKLEFSPVLI